MVIFRNDDVEWVYIVSTQLTFTRLVLSLAYNNRFLRLQQVSVAEQIRLMLSGSTT